MISFIRKYSLVLFVLVPSFIFLGNFVQMLAFMVVPLVFFLFYQAGRRDLILICFFLILVLADSRAGYFSIAKPLRTPAFVSIGLFTVLDLIRRRYFISRISFAFLPFFFISIIALYESPVFQSSLNRTFSYALLIFVVLHFLKDSLRTYGAKMVRDLVYFGAFIMTVSLVLIPLVPSLVWFEGSYRFRGLLGNPNGLGVFVTLFVPLFNYYMMKRENMSRSEKAYLYFISTVCVLLSASRNAIFACTFFYVLHLSFSVSLLKRLFLIVGVFPAMFILLYVIEFESLVQMLGLGDYFRLSDFDSGSGRFYAWQQALQPIREHPWIGQGFYFDEYFFREMVSEEFKLLTGHQGGVHSSWFVFLMNTGILGFISILFVIGTIIWGTRDYKVLLPFLVTAAFSMTFESWLSASLNAFTIFFFFGLLIYKEDISEQQFQFE